MKSMVRYGRVYGRTGVRQDGCKAPVVGCRLSYAYPILSEVYDEKQCDLLNFDEFRYGLPRS